MGDVNNPKVGDTFYVARDGVNARGGVSTYTAICTKVGRKYFELDLTREDDSRSGGYIKAEIGRSVEVTNYNPFYSIWADKKTYEDLKSRRELCDKVSRCFRQYIGGSYEDISNESLLTIASILKIEV